MTRESTRETGIKLIFYHRTTEEAWEKIQAEGVLWGCTTAWSEGFQHEGPRYTYLAPYDFGDSYGSILLEVEYDPVGAPDDNYGFDPPPGQVCWQFSVFVPIDIKHVKVLTKQLKET